jgi:hypothetical protein
VTRAPWVETLNRLGPVPTRQRVALALAVACLTAWVTWRKDVAFPFPRDLGQVWFAARSILHGVDPYPLVGPGRAFDFDYPLLYPLPAGVALLPLGALPLHVATVLFSFACGGALAWAVMRRGYGPLFGMLSAPVHYAAETAQWSPLFAASVVVPWLALFLVAKPTIGLAAFVARPSWWAVAGGILFGGVAFAVNPHWVGEWLGAVHRNAAQWAPDRPYRIPITYPGGALALLALLRWRRPEARYLAVLACVPQTPLQYEAVPLLLIPRTFWEAAGLFALSYAGHLATEYVAPQGAGQPHHLAVSGQMIVLFLYLPATALLLTRPHRSDVDGESDGGTVGGAGRDARRRRDRDLLPVTARVRSARG